MTDRDAMYRAKSYGSVCSGIEAASVAWHSLGWQPSWFAEIEKFPSAVLAHRFPDVPNLGDMTTIASRIRAGEVDAPEILVGGTPCQAFSVAGIRGGLSDPRGALTLAYVDLANAIDTTRHLRGDQPAIIVWENVPGVLSSKDNAFGCFLGGLAGEDCELQPPRGKWTDAGCVFGPQRAIAWRTLDAQYFGLAQRRRRVFVVASARKGFNPAEVLFEFDGLRRDFAPRRESGEGSTAGSAPGVDLRCGCGYRFDLSLGAYGCPNCEGDNGPAVSCQTTIMSSGQANAEIRVDGGAPALTCLHEAPIIAHALRGEGLDASEDCTGRGTPLVPVAIQDVRGTDKAQNGRGWNDDGVAYTLDTHATQGVMAPVAFPANLSGTQHASAIDLAPSMGAKNPTAVAFDILGTPASEVAKEVDIHTPLRSRIPGQLENSTVTMMVTNMQVRRLTPRECERLQGFPDVLKKYTVHAWVEDEKQESAPSAEPSSAAQSRAQSAPVAVHVRIDCERQEVLLLNAGRWTSLACTAGGGAGCRPLMQPADIARLAALTLQCVELVIRDGKAESLQSMSGSFHPLSGSASVLVSGHEIAALAADAELFTTEKARCMKSIMSVAGPSSPTVEQTLQTLCCCVVAAIGSFIPSSMPTGSSFSLSIETVAPYTLIPWRKKPASECPDGPRYKALGNSMAVPCMRWIGMRIDEALIASVKSVMGESDGR